MSQDHGGREGREEVISSFPLLSPTTSLGWFLLWSKPLLYPFKQDPSCSEVSHYSLASWCFPTPGPSVLASGVGPSVMVTQHFSLPPPQPPLPARIRSPLTFLTIIRARSCAKHFLCISHLIPSMILAQRGSVTSRRSPSKPVLVQRFTQA